MKCNEIKLWINDARAIFLYFCLLKWIFAAYWHMILGRILYDNSEGYTEDYATISSFCH